MLIKDGVKRNIDTSNVLEKRNLFIEKYLSNKSLKILYLHIPFCPSKCKYCICETKVCNKVNELESFVRVTLKEQIINYKALLEQIEFDQLYIGGGTPTILSASLLEEMFNMLPCIENIPIKCVECSPNTLTKKHLDLLVKYKFSFLSMGVQSLQSNICKWQNRYPISKEELAVISKEINKTGIYFNYDMICYLGKGDIRDIPAFEEDMEYIMKVCKPSSICVHQHHQIEFSIEKTSFLQKTLTRLTEEKKLGYECVNALLDEREVVLDTMYQAQYRLVRERRNFNHYMWKRYPMIPVKGYDVLGLGFIDNIQVKSNVDTLVFVESRNKFSTIEFQEFVYEDFEQIRQIKGLK